MATFKYRESKDSPWKELPVVGDVKFITDAEGEIDITENGTYDVSRYASAKVAIADKGIAQMASGKVFDLTPENLTGITEIGTKAFYYAPFIGSVTLPDTVTIIRDSAFERCECTSVTIPDSVTFISSRAFQYASKMSTITLPNTNIIYNNMSVAYTGLTELNVPGGVIKSGAFPNNEKIKKLTVGEGVSEIGKSAFYCLYKLEELRYNTISAPDFSDKSSVFERAGRDTEEGTKCYIGKHVKKIPAHLFTSNYVYNNSNNNTYQNYITEYVFEEDSECEVIGSSAFRNNEFMVKMTLPASLKEIGNYAFYQCKRWKGKIIIPDGVTRISDSAFNSCSLLTDITIGDKVTTIERSTFEYCKGLTRFIFPKSVTSIKNRAFAGCTKLRYFDMTSYGTDMPFPTLDSTTIFVDCGTQTDSGTFEIRVPMGRKAELVAMTNWSTYANNIVEVEPGEIEEPDIPDEPETPNPAPTKGLAHQMSSSGLYMTVTGIGTATDSVIIIPDNYIGIPVTELASSTFSGLTNITKVTFPNTVTKTGNYTFSGCTGLEAVILSNSMAKIASSFCKDCSSLKNITIPNCVTGIESTAFSGCVALEVIDLTEYGSDIAFPTLANTNVFTNCGTSTASGAFEIRVPTGRQSELAAMTNWSSFADNIVEV